MHIGFKISHKNTMNKFKQIIFGWCFLSFGLTGLQAQNIKFRFKDGSVSEYTVAEVRNITFTNDVMHLNKKDGSTVSWNVNIIGKYNYTNLTAGINLPLTNMANNDLLVFPNPANGDITIEYNVSCAGKVSIDILNPTGQMIRHMEEEQGRAGKFTVNWDGKDANGNILPTGTYICYVNAGGNLSTEKILIVK
jgi:hypothetical protein